MGFTIDGKNLVKYEEENGLTEVIIPEGVESVAFSAFIDCKNIRKIAFPSTLKVIKSISLEYCRSLEEIVINEGTEKIDWQVFWGISDYAPIKKISLPKTCGCFCRWTPALDSFCLEDGIVYTPDKKRIIYCLPGVEEEYTIPDSVESIDQYAFSHTNRKSITVPTTVELPKDAFFDFKDFSNYVENKEVLRLDLKSKTKLPAYYSEYMKITKINGEDIAFVVTFQSGKGWDNAINEKILSNNALVNEAIRCFDKLLPGNKEAVYKKVADFVIQYSQYASGVEVKSLIDFYDSNKSKSVETLKKDMGVQKALSRTDSEEKSEEKVSTEEAVSTNTSSDNPIEEIVRANWKGSKIVSALKEKITNGISYSEGNGISSPEAVIFVIASYAEQIDDSIKQYSMYKSSYVQTHFDRIADEVAKGLSLDELQQMLDSLIFEDDKTDSSIILAYGRYASSKQIQKLTTAMNKWSNYGEFGATGRKKIIVARGALMLSDTREAMLAVDKTKALNYYASIRDTDEETIRDRVLSDFGFDNNRQKAFDLGGYKAIVSLADDLTLTIYDESTKKVVKSIPKKNANPQLYDKAKSEYAEMKKNIKKVVAGRSKLLFEEFLSARSYSYDNWAATYTENEVLKAVGTLVVWKQKDNYFVIDREGKIIDFNCTPITISKNDSIQLAHPLEMEKKDIHGWQEYFISNNLKQPFEQIWEPAYNLKNIRKNRYDGCSISVFKTVEKESEGISSWGIGMYSEDYGFSLKDCEINYSRDTTRLVPGVTNDAKYVLGEFSITNNSRYSNHIVYLLDKWTVEERITNDDVSIVDVLDVFTMAQIDYFINIAREAGANSVLAQLLDYKNKTYADCNPMDKYVLDI